MSFEDHSFCESIHASSSSPWHIRKLTSKGRKLGGGIDTPTLCDLIYPLGAPIPRKNHTGNGGWDVAVPITLDILLRDRNGVCEKCQKALLGVVHETRTRVQDRL